MEFRSYLLFFLYKKGQEIFSAWLQLKCPAINWDLESFIAFYFFYGWDSLNMKDKLCICIKKKTYILYCFSLNISLNPIEIVFKGTFWREMWVNGNAHSLNCSYLHFKSCDLSSLPAPHRRQIRRNLCPGQRKIVSAKGIGDSKTAPGTFRALSRSGLPHNKFGTSPDGSSPQKNENR
jgi:hypothetical protein